MINQFSSQEEKKNSSDALFDSFAELLFQRVSLINGTFIVSESTTNTSQYTINVRVLDSSERVFMRPDKQIRFRASLYMGGDGAQKADFYVLVPAVLSNTAAVSFSSPHRYITRPTDFDSFVGIRFLEGSASLVSWSGKELVSKETQFNLTGSDTIYLEIFYNITGAEFYINNRFVGSIEADLGKTLYTYKNFYPIVAPTRSIDGSPVNLNFESYQILQEK